MKKILALLLALTMVFTLCACGNTPAPTEATSTEAASTEAASTEAASTEAAATEATAPAEPKRTDLKIQLKTEPTTFDFQQDQSTARTLIGLNLFANLLTYDKDDNLIGELAETWSHNDDFSEWTFVLNPNAKFSDGSPVTADDVVYSFNRAKELAVIVAFSSIDSVEAVSEREVKFVLAATEVRFDHTVAGDGYCILSKAYMEGGADLTKEAAITSGPYYLDQWNLGSDIVLKANEYYVLGEPEIKEVDCIFIADDNTAIVAFESGQVDYITCGNTLLASEVETVETFDNVQFVPLESASYSHMGLNFGFEPFADKNVRKAINLCLNRDYFIAILGGMGIPAGVLPVFEGVGGYLPGYDIPAGDVEAAKAALAESAYPDGFTFKLSCFGSSVSLAENIQSQLKEIGIIVDIDQCPDNPTLIQKIINASYEGYITSYTGVDGDIGSFVGLYSSEGALNGDRPNDYGPKLVESKSLVGAEREAVLKEAYDIMADTVPYIGLYFKKGLFACSADLDFGVNTIHSYLQFDTMSWN